MSVVVATALPNYPTVRLLVDGAEVLNPDGQETGNDPADLLDTGALLPVEPARRIALYGCGCGEFGCTCVSALITTDGERVHWTDFRTFTGVYGSALPPEEEGPDPATSYPGRQLALPDLSFDAVQYADAVAAATTDRSWESRPRATARLLRERRPDLWPWAAHKGDAITLNYRTEDHRNVSVDLALPVGPVESAVERLTLLLGEHEASEVAARGLW